MGFGGKHLPEIVVFASAFIVLQVFALRSPVWYDDACHYLTVKSLAETGVESFGGHPFSTFITVGPAVNYPCAWFLKAFGVSMHSARVFMSFYAVLGLFGIYLLTKDVYKDSRHARTMALWAVVLTAFTVQYSVYGAQVLGEVPAMAWTFFGLLLLDKSPVFAGVCFGMAGLCKEYIAAPLAVLLVGFAYKFSWKSVFVVGGIALAMVAFYYAFRFGTVENIEKYWVEKWGYKSEFAAFVFTEPIRFILTKPLIVLGTLALIYRNPGGLLLFHLSLALFYLLSAGYDRFGLWLIPGAAMGIAPYMRYFFSQKKLLIVAVLLAASIQKTPYTMLKYILNTPNEEEKNIAQTVGETRVFTYELPVAIFCKNVKLPKHPPAVSHLEPPPILTEGGYFVAGPYANTEYFNFVVSPNWRTVYQSKNYRIYANRDKI